MTTKHLIKILKTGLALVILLFSISCSKEDPITTELATDYSQISHWLPLPATSYNIDVFYLYPTAWTNTDSLPVICAIDDSSMLVKAPMAYARQATAFETAANIYAPFYRQNNSSPVDRLNVIADIPTLDATEAFDYYIKHYNNGRPFILAGHSQGATVLTNLLSGYLKNNPKVYARMIAAYIIGSPITQAYLNENPHLKFATGPDDTGVIISWNTEGPNVTVVNPVLYGEVGLVINPITWTREETVATAAQSLGSFMPDASMNFVKVPAYADARVDIAHGVLICSTASEDALYPFTKTFGKGIYHSFDYSFYYYNLRQNAENRVAKFLKNNQKVIKTLDQKL